MVNRVGTLASRSVAVIPSLGRADKSARGARVDVSNWQWMREGGSSAPLSFVLAPGDRVLLRGQSGAGKSTLLTRLAGLDVDLATEGIIRINGDESHHLRGDVGYLLQDPLTQAVMPRVGDDVAFGLENIGVDPAAMPERIRHALASVGLDLQLDALTDQLSGGQRQRLALAGVLAMRPSLLLLDEPTAHLDPAGAELIRDAVREAVRDRHITLVVVDHTEGFWADVVDREIVMGGEGGAKTRDARRVPARSPELPAHETPVSPPQPATLARAKNLAVGYPRSSLAQNNLNFEVVAGRILTVTGPNGAGKSALALTLAGLIPAHAGELQLDRHRVPVGLVFQTPEHQFIGSTVRADVVAGMRGTRGERDSRTHATLDEFHLTHLAAQNPFTLSGGEKRRLSIADITATLSRDRPAVLILDEPTTGLDHESWYDVVESLRAKASDGHAIVVITHDKQLICAISDERLELSS